VHPVACGRLSAAGMGPKLTSSPKTFSLDDDSFDPPKSEDDSNLVTL
jgi:hypothetical protein